MVVTIDIETKDQQKVKQNISNSMSEQRTRIMYAKDMQEKIEAEDEFSDLEQLYNEVSRMNQVMKLIHVRLFVSGRTIAEVENNAKEYPDSKKDTQNVLLRMEFQFDKDNSVWKLSGLSSSTIKLQIVWG